MRESDEILILPEIIRPLAGWSRYVLTFHHESMTPYIIQSKHCPVQPHNTGLEGDKNTNIIQHMINIKSLSPSEGI